MGLFDTLNAEFEIKERQQPVVIEQPVKSFQILKKITTYDKKTITEIIDTIKVHNQNMVAILRRQLNKKVNMLGSNYELVEQM